MWPDEFREGCLGAFERRTKVKAGCRSLALRTTRFRQRLDQRRTRIIQATGNGGHGRDSKRGRRVEQQSRSHCRGTTRRSLRNGDMAGLVGLLARCYSIGRLAGRQSLGVWLATSLGRVPRESWVVVPGASTETWLQHKVGEEAAPGPAWNVHGVSKVKAEVTGGLTKRAPPARHQIPGDLA